jgi:DNA-binding CsgD family transcriptional regulator
VVPCAGRARTLAAGAGHGRAGAHHRAGLGHHKPTHDRLARGDCELAHRYGAAVLVERARTELLAAGARPRRVAVSGREAPTPTETRVAATGLANPAIAEQLVVSRRTVEMHLSNTYRKLGIGSRTDLPIALAWGNWGSLARASRRRTEACRELLDGSGPELLRRIRDANRLSQIDPGRRAPQCTVEGLEAPCAYRDVRVEKFGAECRVHARRPTTIS